MRRRIVSKPSRDGGISGDPPGRQSPWPWLIALGSLLVVLLGVIFPRPRTDSASLAQPAPAGHAAASHVTDREHPFRPPRASVPAQTPEEIVAGKIARFAEDRLRITRAMAERYKITVPAEVERFFQAVAAGNWEELNAQYKALKQRRDSGNDEALRGLWGPILETQLVAECSHDWPARKLLEYGEATLGALRPGMVYVGGTDPGRGIPTLLNETGEGERHIVITQNALADQAYLRYVNFLYGDRAATLSSEDSQRAFQDYIIDAKKRFAHDEEFPHEPKQLRPGEDLQVSDNRVQVSGQVAVMAINERLLQAFMAKNPTLGFALEESYPLPSTYPNAVPLGPLMELGVPDSPSSFTSDAAIQAVHYWGDTARGILSEADSPIDSPPRLTYAKMAAAQAALLAEHQYPAEAEQAYRFAVQISSANPDAIYGLGRLLVTTGRADEARQLVAQFEQSHPVTESHLPCKLAYEALIGR